MQAQSGQSLHASALLRYAVAFRFVSCLFPHVGQSSGLRALHLSSAKIETTVNIGRGGCMGHLFAKAAKRIRVLQVGP